MGTLYIVATPIGNLEDITHRAIRILSEVYLILCEDTRTTQKLLNHYDIKTPTLSYHQHSKLEKVKEILGLLRQGKDLALVSDAGTPGVSDPGGQLISEVHNSGFKVAPVPGVSALTAAASISGFPTDKFVFMGFPPAKNKRKKFFEDVADSKYSVILYESPYRIIKTLKELSSACGNRELIVCRELTKKFETIYRGTPSSVISQLGNSETKGEFVVIVKGK